MRGAPRCLRGGVVGLLLAGACAGAGRQARADLKRALVVADELEAAGSYMAARHQLEAAIGVAPPEQADELWLAFCATFEGEGQSGEGLRCYAEREALLQTDEGRALAAYRRATLLLGQGDEAGAILLFASVLTRFPGTDGSGRALRSQRALARLQGGTAAELAILGEAADSLCAVATPSARAVCCEAAIGGAQLTIADQGDAPAAERWLGRCPVAEAAAWGDDLLWWQGRAARLRGDRQAEMNAYRRLIEAQESSWFVGSYASTYLDDAYLALAEALEAVGDLAGARQTYVELIAEAPRSRLVDDAAFGAARLDFGRGDRRALERFVADFPDSRHARQARQLLGRP